MGDNARMEDEGMMGGSGRLSMADRFSKIQGARPKIGGGVIMRGRGGKTL